MAIRFTHSPGPASAASIRAAEKTLGVHFPPDYKRFLQTCNGGAPNPNQVRLRDGRVTWIEHLFAVYAPGRRRTGLDLVPMVKQYRDELKIPDSLLPIGHFEHSTILYLGLTGKHRGHVVSDFAEFGFNSRKLSKMFDSVSELIAELDSNDAHDKRRGSNNRTKLLRALAKRDLATIERLVRNLDLSSKSWWDLHPAYEAIRNKDLELIQVLCRAGASFDTTFGEKTPLEAARHVLREARVALKILNESRNRKVVSELIRNAESGIARLTEIVKLIQRASQ